MGPSVKCKTQTQVHSMFATLSSAEPLLFVDTVYVETIVIRPTENVDHPARKNLLTSPLRIKLYNGTE